MARGGCRTGITRRDGNYLRGLDIGASAIPCAATPFDRRPLLLQRPSFRPATSSGAPGSGSSLARSVAASCSEMTRGSGQLYGRERRCRPSLPGFARQRTRPARPRRGPRLWLATAWRADALRSLAQPHVRRRCGRRKLHAVPTRTNSEHLYVGPLDHAGRTTHQHGAARSTGSYATRFRTHWPRHGSDLEPGDAAVHSVHVVASRRGARLLQRDGELLGGMTRRHGTALPFEERCFTPRSCPLHSLPASQARHLAEGILNITGSVFEIQWRSGCGICRRSGAGIRENSTPASPGHIRGRRT